MGKYLDIEILNQSIYTGLSVAVPAMGHNGAGFKPLSTTWWPLTLPGHMGGIGMSQIAILLEVPQVFMCFFDVAHCSNLRGGTQKVGKQERNRRKNEGERGGKNT